jgi:hypothetical protein
MGRWVQRKTCRPINYCNLPSCTSWKLWYEHRHTNERLDSPCVIVRVIALLGRPVLKLKQLPDAGNFRPSSLIKAITRCRQFSVNKLALQNFNCGMLHPVSIICLQWSFSLLKQTTAAKHSSAHGEPTISNFSKIRCCLNSDGFILKKSIVFYVYMLKYSRI